MPVMPLRDLNPTNRRPFVTVALIIACIVVWVSWQQEPTRTPTQDLVFDLEHAAIPCELVEGRPLTLEEVRTSFGTAGGDVDSCGVAGGLGPPAVPGKSIWLSAVASMFLHGGLLHIAGNMLYLWIFGNNIEDRMGALRYVAFYLVGGLAATAAHVALQPSSTVPLVGASGAIAAVMGAYLFWFPDAPVRSVVMIGFPIVATVRAKWLLGVWFLTQFFTSPNSGVAWAAHVGGFVFGAAFALLVRSDQRLARLAFADPPARSDQGWDRTGGVGRIDEYRRLGRG